MQVSMEFLHQLVECLEQAIRANQSTPNRTGCLIQLSGPACKEVWVAGDLHGNRPHYNKIIKAADLAAHPFRHLVLQEVVHGGPTYPNGGDMSHMLLEEIAALKVKFPDRFHFLLCNHELSEATNLAMAKSGVSQNQQFALGLEYAYGPASDRIKELYHEFIFSCPLAIRLQNGVLISHSLPTAKMMKTFDKKIFFRELTRADFETGGSANSMVWGRDYAPEHVKQFAWLMKTTAMVHGHEPCPEGYKLPNDLQILLDASGEHCYVCVLPTTGKLTNKEIKEQMLRLT